MNVPGSEYVHLGFYFRGTKGSVNVCVRVRVCACVGRSYKNITPFTFLDKWTNIEVVHHDT